MPEQRKKNHQIEETLSGFADQVIGTKNPSAVPLSADEQINQLQKTVLQLNEIRPKPASVESAEKIQKNLQSAWKEAHTRNPSLIENLLKRFKPRTKATRYRSSSRRRQIMVTRVATAAVVVILAAFVFLPDSGISGGSTSGAAAGDLNPWVIIGGLGLLGGTALWWWFKSRRN